MEPIPPNVQKNMRQSSRREQSPPCVIRIAENGSASFFDFGGKHALPASRSDQVRMLMRKLREKRQTMDQLNQAAHSLPPFLKSCSGRYLVA
jgi:hypothetical protein